MKSIVDQKTASSSDVLKPVVSRKKKTKTKNKMGKQKTMKKKKKNSRQIRKTNQALEYLSERKLSITKPSRPAPPPPSPEDDDTKTIEEKDYVSRTSVQRRIDALNRMKLNGTARRMPIPKRSLKKKGPPTVPRRGKKMTPKLKAIVEKMGGV